jgi:hypothetical protein
MFPLDSIMYEGMELTFNQEHQALYVPPCPSVNIFGVDQSGSDNIALYNTRMYKCHTRVCHVDVLLIQLAVTVLLLLL